MNVKYTRFIYLSVFLTGSFHLKAQIRNQNNKVWEKPAIEASRDSTKCNRESLLNFHCNIRGKSKPFKYGKNDSQSLIVVHNSNEEENIWYNKEVISELNNHSFKNSKGKPITLKKKPSIFSYLSPKNNQKIKKDSIDIALQDNNLYEALFIPKKIKKTDLDRVHSYLSIKYGISLKGVKYFNSNGDVIWDPEKHKEFKDRPTGLGRDDNNELYQKQSSNQEDKIVVIGREKIARTNFDNKASLDNNTFVIWSDDNKDLDFEEKEDLRVLKRNWQINFIGKTIPKKGYSVQVGKNLMNPEGLRLNYWMLIKNDDGTIQKIAGKVTGDAVEYSGVAFPDDKNEAVFTFATNISKDVLPEHGSTAENQPPVRTNGPGEGTSDLKYLLYPNPVKINSHFTVKFPPTEGLEISIYDGGGRILSSEKMASDAVIYQSKLNVQGIYLVILTENKKLIKAFKVIVN